MQGETIQGETPLHRWRLLRSLPLQMLLGIVLGGVIGLQWPTFGSQLQPIGTAFVDAIKMVVIPLVFSAVTLGAAKMGNDARQLGRTALVAFGWFYFASAVSIAVALGLNAIFQPGLGAGLAPTGQVPVNVAFQVDWVKFLLDLIPSNVIAAMAGQKVLPTLVFATLFGLALGAIGEKARPIVAVLEATLGALFRLTDWVIKVSPVAVFAIAAWLLATQGVATILALGKLTGTIYLGYGLLALVTMIAIRLAGQNPLVVARAVSEPVLLAFVTRSSEVALPSHIEKLEQLGVPERIVSVVLPLGYSFNMDGSALYLGAAVTFLAQAYGLHLTGAALMTILITALIASKGVANVPSASLVALATILSAIGLPLEAVAIVAGIDALLDMGRAGLNVFGNTAAVLIVRRFADPSLASDPTRIESAEMMPERASSLPGAVA